MGKTLSAKVVRARRSEVQPKGKRTILPGNPSGFQAERSAACEIAREQRQPGRRLFNFPLRQLIRASPSGEAWLQTEVPLPGARKRNRRVDKQRRRPPPHGLPRNSAESRSEGLLEIPRPPGANSAKKPTEVAPATAQPHKGQSASCQAEASTPMPRRQSPRLNPCRAHVARKAVEPSSRTRGETRSDSLGVLATEFIGSHLPGHQRKQLR